MPFAKAVNPLPDQVVLPQPKDRAGRATHRGRGERTDPAPGEQREPSGRPPTRVRNATRHRDRYLAATVTLKPPGRDSGMRRW